MSLMVAPEGNETIVTLRGAKSTPTRSKTARGRGGGAESPYEVRKFCGNRTAVGRVWSPRHALRLVPVSAPTRRRIAPAHRRPLLPGACHPAWERPGTCIAECVTKSPGRQKCNAECYTNPSPATAALPPRPPDEFVGAVWGRRSARTCPSVSDPALRPGPCSATAVRRAVTRGDRRQWRVIARLSGDRPRAVVWLAGADGSATKKTPSPEIGWIAPCREPRVDPRIGP